MSGKKILAALVEFGYNVIIRSEYHAQIETVNGFHDMWMNKYGDFKVKLCGNREVIEYRDMNSLLHKLAGFDYSLSDKASLDAIERVVKIAKGKPGIYVDAGYKDGKSRIAAVRIADNGNIDAHVRNCTSHNNSLDAELDAIQLARLWFEDDSEIIFSDCKPAVQLQTDQRVQWVSREKNQQADKLSNLRGQ